MDSQYNAIAIILANRCYLYILLRHVFGHEPNREMLKAVTSDHTREAMELISDGDEFVPYIERFAKLRQAVSNDTETVLDRLKSEYTYLLIGPNKLPAPPWESVYITKERLILQESTLQVRRAYLAYQFLPANYPHEADDHIAIELDFMARLSQMSREAYEEDDGEKLGKLLSDQKTFLEEHMLNWVGEFSKQIQSSKTHHFYPQMAVLTEQVLRIDRDILEELLSVVENKEERCSVNE